MLTPRWVERLGKTDLSARQNLPRGGELHCRTTGDGRVELTGQAAPFMERRINA